MTVKLLTEQHLEFLISNGGCTGLAEPTLVKIPHCWKSHVVGSIVLIIKPSHEIFVVTALSAKKAQGNLGICLDSPERLLLTYTNY